MTKRDIGARTNRGLGNGKGDKWYNAPIWDAIEKKKKKKADQ